MNQNPIVVRLREFTKNERPFGNIEGKLVFHKLSEFIEKHPKVDVFGISLEGIEVTDASFPRESVVTLAKQLRGEKGIFLTNLSDRDLIDNWNYAAEAKDQPLVIWNDGSFEIIGPELNKSARELIEYVLKTGSVLASQVASDLNISVQNASTRLKNLVKQGYILRSEDVADSGGIEFKYSAIK